MQNDRLANIGCCKIELFRKDSIPASTFCSGNAMSMTQKPLVRRAVETIGGIGLFLIAILLYNGGLWLSEGEPTIPKIEGQWWAGYFATGTTKQWCLARFIKSGAFRLEMIVLSSSGSPMIFDVERNSSNETFVYLTFVGRDQTRPLRIEAKQLYAGERYYLGRLLAGRFSDFWEPNKDITIRGTVASATPEEEFAIEPLPDERLDTFWKTYVRPDRPLLSPNDLLSRLGIRLAPP
jgi:hypothetical protein